MGSDLRCIFRGAIGFIVTKQGSNIPNNGWTFWVCITNEKDFCSINSARDIWFHQISEISYCLKFYNYCHGFVSQNRRNTILNVLSCHYSPKVIYRRTRVYFVVYGMMLTNSIYNGDETGVMMCSTLVRLIKVRFSLEKSNPTY